MADARRDRWGRYLVVPPEGGKPLGYTRVTTIAKTLDDGAGLMPWKATASIVGTLRRPGIMASWQALIAEHPDPWYGSADSKAKCKKLVEQAAEAGGSTDRADIGTALHALIELGAKTGWAETPILQPAMAADVAAYRTTLDAAGIVVERNFVESVVVLDRFQAAGTSDNLAIVVPGYGRVVGDLKTGTDLKYSWQAIAIQLAAYANADAVYVQGEAGDGSQDQREPMPNVSKQVGLVIHLPAGEGRCELHLVDLVAGWEAFQQSMAVRAWRARRDVAKPLEIAAAPVAAAVAPVQTATAPVPDFDAVVPATPAPRPAPDSAPVQGTIEPPPFDAPVEAVATPSSAAGMASAPAATEAPPTHGSVVEPATGGGDPPVATIACDHPEDKLRQVGRCIYCECGFRLGQGKLRAPKPKAAPATTAGAGAAEREPAVGVAITASSPAPAPLELATPDEGPAVDAAAVAALRERYAALPREVRSGWLYELAEQAMQGVNGRGRVPYVLGGDQGKHTLRRFEITRGLVALCEAEITDDDVLRALVASIVGDDVVWFPTTLPGQCAGLLSADEAATFAGRCELLVSGSWALAFRDDGRPIVAPLAA